MLIEYVTPDFIFGDDRGKLTQIVHDGFKQVNYIHSVAGAIRGGHFHEKNRELFFVIRGKFKLTLFKDGIKEQYTLKDGDCFIINPYVVHDFVFMDDTDLVSMYSIGVEMENGTKDIIRQEIP